LVDDHQLTSYSQDEFAKSKLFSSFPIPPLYNGRVCHCDATRCRRMEAGKACHGLRNVRPRRRQHCGNVVSLFTCMANGIEKRTSMKPWPTSGTTSKTQDTNSKRNPREVIGPCFLNLWRLLLPSWHSPLFLDSPTFLPSSFDSRHKGTCLRLPSLDGNP
jgi:hypothetical protein